MTVIPTRPTFPPLRWLARAYLQMRVRGAEADIAHAQTQHAQLPAQIKAYEREAAKYRVLLAIVN